MQIEKILSYAVQRGFKNWNSVRSDAWKTLLGHLTDGTQDQIQH